MENSRLTCCELLSKLSRNLSALFVQDICLWTQLFLVFARGLTNVALAFVIYRYYKWFVLFCVRHFDHWEKAQWPQCECFNITATHASTHVRVGGIHFFSVNPMSWTILYDTRSYMKMNLCVNTILLLYLCKRKSFWKPVRHDCSSYTLIPN